MGVVLGRDPRHPRVEARATDATGYTQTPDQAPTEPNGATGYPANTVTFPCYPPALPRPRRLTRADRATGLVKRRWYKRIATTVIPAVQPVPAIWAYSRHPRKTSAKAREGTFVGPLAVKAPLRVQARRGSADCQTGKPCAMRSIAFKIPARIYR